MKQALKDHPVFWILGLAVVSFVAGFGAYQGILSVGSYTTIATAELNQLREITKTGPNENPATKPTCASLQVSVFAPNTVEPNQAFQVQGGINQLPEDFAIWLFFTDPEGYEMGYYPRTSTNTLVNGQWRVTEPGERRGSNPEKHYSIFLVGKDGAALIRTYKMAMNAMGRRWLELTKESIQYEWEPLKEVTSDMDECESFIVKS